MNDLQIHLDGLIESINTIKDLDEENDWEESLELRVGLESFKILYINAISNPCTHQKFNFIRVEGGIDLTCCCCEKVVEKYASFEEAQKHIDISQIKMG